MHFSHELIQQISFLFDMFFSKFIIAIFPEYIFWTFFRNFPLKIAVSNKELR